MAMIETKGPHKLVLLAAALALALSTAGCAAGAGAGSAGPSAVTEWTTHLRSTPTQASVVELPDSAAFPDLAAFIECGKQSLHMS
jgi:hypothetical protein